MRLRTFFLTLALVVIGAASVNAQVIIGSASKDPHAGSILDLASGGQNNLGLLLPNVQLNNDASTFVLVSETTDEEEAKRTATGMLVYNTVGVPDGQGLYVWNGASWMPISKNPCPRTVEDLEGNKYAVGNFGDAGCWMTQNLRYKGGFVEFADYNYPGPHEETPELISNSATFDKHNEYGLLYNWATATSRSEAGSESEDTDPPHPYQGICPNNWHVPSDKEWNDLEEVIAQSAQGVYSEDGSLATWNEEFRTTVGNRGSHGTKMKSRTAVEDADAEYNPNGLSYVRNKNGFDVLLVGHRLLGPTYAYGTGAHFWSSTSFDDEKAWYRFLNSEAVTVSRGAIAKNYKFSVRCKKD
jgi:uncharacterized protein (TIGR02145 family)